MVAPLVGLFLNPSHFRGYADPRAEMNRQQPMVGNFMSVRDNGEGMFHLHAFVPYQGNR
jgi:hypothetical protein